jgi:nucleoside-diphosphate-sugar epimerase
MHIALTGASGFIGSAICRAATEAGHTVTALVRQTSRRDHIEPHVARFVTGDHADETCWPYLLDGADAVIHNSADWRCIFRDSADPAAFDRHLASNLVGSIRLLRASAPRPFVYMSSIAVHHDMRPRWQGRIDEDHPLRPNSMYGAFKAAVEAHLWAEHYATGRHTVAIRPCGVYGLDPRLDRTHGYPIVRKIAAGQRFDKQGGGKFVHVDDVALATVRAVERDDAAGKPFNLVDCYARWGDWATMAASLLGVDADIDLSSPQRPQNEFSKEQTRSILGVPLDRGHDGIKTEIAKLIEELRDRGELD